MNQQTKARVLALTRTPRPGMLPAQAQLTRAPYELAPFAGASPTRVTCTYDWTQLTDQKRFRRTRASFLTLTGPCRQGNMLWPS